MDGQTVLVSTGWSKAKFQNFGEAKPQLLKVHHAIRQLWMYFLFKQTAQFQEEHVQPVRHLRTTARSFRFGVFDRALPWKEE